MKTPLYVTAVDENAGKTIVTLGLMGELVQRFERVGFIKPLGIARVRAGREAIDLDALLINGIAELHENIKDMCPVTLGPTSWPSTMPGEAQRVFGRMQEAYERISEGRDVVLVEGTGHAALGGGIGLSNAEVAAKFGCKVVLCAAYGTLGDNPFDKALLNKEFFARHDVEVIGLVINRVPADRIDAYAEYATLRLDAVGVRLLGLIPNEPTLQSFRFLNVVEYLDGELIGGQSNAEVTIDRVRVGAMTPHRALEYFSTGSLIITPGDREDLIVTVCAMTRGKNAPSGLVLSGGCQPHPRILDLLIECGIPTFLAAEDSYTVASKIHDMPLRIQPTDTDKIELVKRLVREKVDVDAIVDAL